MLIYAMSVSADGYVTDRTGAIDWTAPSDELFRHHLAQVAALGAYLLGRRLYETMRVWETDPALRDSADGAAFAEVWTALPKVVFSRTLDRVPGNARLARGPLADEVAVALGTGRDVEIGGAALAAEAVRQDLVDEFRTVRHPVLLGGGTPYFPPLARTIPLELVEASPIAPGVVFERYRRRR